MMCATSAKKIKPNELYCYIQAEMRIILESTSWNYRENEMTYTGVSVSLHNILSCISYMQSEVLLKSNKL